MYDSLPSWVLVRNDYLNMNKALLFWMLLQRNWRQLCPFAHNKKLRNSELSWAYWYVCEFSITRSHFLWIPKLQVERKPFFFYFLKILRYFYFRKYISPACYNLNFLRSCPLTVQRGLTRNVLDWNSLEFLHVIHVPPVKTCIIKL